MPQAQAGAYLAPGGESQDPQKPEHRAGVHREPAARAGGAAQTESPQPRQQRLPAAAPAPGPRVLSPSAGRMRGLDAVGGAPRTLSRLGAPGLDKLDPPLLWMGTPSARSPPSRRLCTPSPTRGCPFVPPSRGSKGRAASRSAFISFFFFFFCLLEERTGVSDFALFMFLLGNKRWLRVACVFPCVGFLKKREEEKKNPPPLSPALSPPPDTIPSLFVWFCFATSPHSCSVILGSPVLCFQ
ncbi:rCG38770 [Rattus norvegicus]|uniref:RCG38770 n=1 Tax=Rattus norvegicus TaxID=10116 RepID=A6KA12_RAT|nr:rCG38770 [Rattus norvegicus]